MARTQIQIEARQAEALKALAHEQGCSMAALIRTSIDRFLAEQVAVSPRERRERAIAAAGRFRSGLTDLGREHDRHLDEAFGR
jgi:hypothetical protein